MYDEFWDSPLWGVQKIAEAAGLTPKAAYHKIEKNWLPVTKVGGTYVTTRRRLRAVWTGEKPGLTDEAAR